MARIWCVGDSLTYQYSMFLATQHPTHEIVNLGRGGDRSDAGLTRVLSYINANGSDPAAGAIPDIALLCWGTNDAVSLIDPNDPIPDIHPTRTASNIELMALALAAEGVKPLIIKPMGVVPGNLAIRTVQTRALADFLNKKTDEQRDAIQQMCRTAHFDYFPFPRRNTLDFWADAFHPTFEKSAEIVAPEIWEQVVRFASAELA